MLFCLIILISIISFFPVHTDRQEGQGHAEAVKLAPTVQAARRTGDPAPTVPAARTVEAGPSGLTVQASRAVNPAPRVEAVPTAPKVKAVQKFEAAP